MTTRSSRPPRGTKRPPSPSGRTPKPSKRPSRPSVRAGSTRAGSVRARSLRPTAPAPPPPRKQHRIGAAIAVIACVAGVYLLLVLGYGDSRGPGAGREVDLDWPAGLHPEEAGERLAAAGLVKSPGLFALYLRAVGGASGMREGRHLLTDDLSPRDLVRRMQQKPVQEHAKITVIEGQNRFDIGKRLQSAKICSARAFLDATTDPALIAELRLHGTSAEGYLFPARYEFALDSDPDAVVRRMTNEFDKRFEKLTRDNPAGASAARGRGWGVSEIVTLASVVEKEAMVDEERPIIASVFLNRLTDATFTPKRLQSDPTSGYGCSAMPENIPSCRAWNGHTITPEMNADDGNPYSTYRHDGLPPGPIGNPGEKSLQAVLVPADTRYFYFVARGEGRHAFSETYAQHNEAIRRSHAAP